MPKLKKVSIGDELKHPMESDCFAKVQAFAMPSCALESFYLGDSVFTRAHSFYLGCTYECVFLNRFEEVEECDDG